MLQVVEWLVVASFSSLLNPKGLLKWLEENELRARYRWIAPGTAFSMEQAGAVNHFGDAKKPALRRAVGETLVLNQYGSRLLPVEVLSLLGA